jgi:putative flippase GtrA
MLSRQLVRYAIVGGVVTALQEAVYLSLAGWAGWHPQLANLAGYLVAVATGFVGHGRVTFAGHGSQGRGTGQAVRFVLVSLLSLALNAFWVWLALSALGGPVWSPVPLKAVVTPLLVFALNRQWVFR